MFENTFLMSFIGFFIILTPLVFIHELGHYFAAIKSGVKVESFSIGFGPELIGFNDKNNTRWKFSLIPLGGYVKMKGELVNVSSASINREDENNTFLNASLASRIFIVISGPIANLILGLILITSIYVFNGRYITPPIVDEVIVSQPAMVAGMQSGDKVISINNIKINDFTKIKKIVEENPLELLSFKVLRNDSLIFLNIIPNNYFDTKSKKILVALVLKLPLQY